MTERVLFEVLDGRGEPVSVLGSRWSHATKGHPELVGEEEAVRLTISEPDLVLRPSNRPKGRGVDRRINCRLDAHSRYKELYVVVPIDYGQKENALVTAYLSPRIPKGELIFARVPRRWS